MRSNVSSSSLILAVGLSACRPRAEAPSKPPAPATMQDRILGILGEVHRLGFALDSERLAVDVRPASGMADAASDYVDLTRRQAFFDAMAQLRHTLQIPPATTGTATRKGVVLMLAADIHAAYDPARSLIIVRNDQTVTDADLARAIATVYLDEALGGLTTSVFDVEAPTDMGLVRQCLAEGFAAYVSASVIAAREHAPVHINYDAPALLATVASVPCGPGIDFVATRYDEGGWRAVLASFAQRPSSTEELMHSEKLGTDFPTPVAIPPWPEDAGEASLTWDDTLGELSIERLLRERGLTDDEASTAATGWDGDRIRIWKLPSGEHALVWRSAWDREEDAQQFSRAIGGQAGETRSFRITQRGRLVDAISVESAPIAKQLDNALAADAEQPPLEPMDAVSTREIEAQPPPGPR